MSARDAETHVSLDLPTYSNRWGNDTYQEFSINLGTTPLSTQNNTQAHNTATTTEQNIHVQSVTPPEPSVKEEKRLEIQQYFQQKIQTESHRFTSNTSATNQNNLNRVDVDELSQSVSWDYSQTFFSQADTQDKKLEELKLLVESLKVIREQQIKLQEKLGVYQEIDQFKGLE